MIEDHRLVVTFWRIFDILNGGLGPVCATGAVSTMTWYDALNQCSAADAMNAMNAGAGYGGRAKWRLATIEELTTLPNLSVVSPAIDAASFPATAASYHWSSSSVSSLVNAWFVSFLSGDSGGSTKTFSYHVRCVTTGP